MIFTQEQINEIKQRLAQSGAKDPQFPLANLPLSGEEIIALVQDGENRRVSIDAFYEEFSRYIDGSKRIDFFNVSRYVQITQDYPEIVRLTLPEAVESCPEEVRRPGQVITFMDDDGWITWQYNGEEKEQWLDLDYWEFLVKPKQELGEGEDVLLSQKVITDNINNLQSQINAIISDKATVALTVSPSTVFADGTDKTVTFVATSSPTKATIVFDEGTPVEATRAEFPVVLSSATPTAIIKSATFVVAGISKGTKSATVKLVYPISYGMQTTYDATTLTQLDTAKASPAGDYTVRVTTAANHLYFKVPKAQVSQIRTVSLVSGTFVNEIYGGIDATLSDADYNVWKSTYPLNVQTQAEEGDVTIRVAV